MRVWQQITNVCTRLTVTRVHFFFVLVTLVHCAALVFLQSVSFVINEEARDFMVNMMTITGAQRDAIAVVAYRPNHALFLCQQVPGSGFLRDEEYFGETGCRQISPPLTLVVDSTDVVATQAQAPVPYKRSRRSLLYPDQMVLVPDELAGQLRGLSIVGLGNSSGILDPNGNLWVSKDCVASLRYPEQEFQDAGRENVSFLFFHVWIVVISFLAIINESIPHLASALAGQCLATVWAAWDVWRTSRFQIRYNLLVAKSVCAGAELIPKYWPTRIKLNVSIICINAGALVLTFWLTVVLIKMFLTSQFRSVGAASSLDRLYRILMAFSTILRLYIFFLVLTTTLWLDQLGTGLLHTFLSKTESDAHIGICSIALILALPLVFVGDISMRIERRVLAFTYLVAQFGYIIFHISLVASSSIYRWMLTLWPFLAVNVAAAIILALISLVLGIICRINFGRGLDHFLHVTSVLEADGFTRAFIAPETEPSKKRFPKGSWDTLVESGETVKVAAAYHRPESIMERPSTSKRSIGTIGRKTKRTRRDSTESFGHTTLDPNASEETFASFIDEKSEVRERDREVERELWASRFDQQSRTNVPPVTMTTRGQDSLMAQDTLVVRDSILAQQITTTDSLPVFDNRAAVRAPDGATGPGS